MTRQTTIILGIETSCDETAVAIGRGVRGSPLTVDASLIASQIALHAPHGGVIPEIASRAHLTDLQPLLEKCLTEASCTLDSLDAIAITQGPGLIGALLVGVSFAKGLGRGLGIPVIPVDHVHAHVHGALISDVKFTCQLPPFPSLALVVTGGHTHLYRMKGPTDFQLLGSTLDDACGESFDKVAKLLGMSYPGGPKIEALARQGNPNTIPMPRMIEQKDRLDFSYSGLKTHAANQIARAPRDGQGIILESWKADLCAAFQQAAFDQLCRKIEQGLKLHPETMSIIVAGGVSANSSFRDLVHRSAGRRPVFFPPLKYCSDNAAMIASLGWHMMHSDERAIETGSTWDAYAGYRYSQKTHSL